MLYVVASCNFVHVTVCVYVVICVRTKSCSLFTMSNLLHVMSVKSWGNEGKTPPDLIVLILTLSCPENKIPINSMCEPFSSCDLAHRHKTLLHCQL